MTTKVYHCSSIDVDCLLNRLNSDAKQYLVEKYIVYASTGRLEQELKRRKETI
jgi:hypothetical protein